MLVLSRRLYESVRIGPDVVVTVVRIKGSSVGIGIEAPRHIEVIRTELEGVNDEATEKAATPRNG